MLYLVIQFLWTKIIEYIRISRIIKLFYISIQTFVFSELIYQAYFRPAARHRTFPEEETFYALFSTPAHSGWAILNS